MVPLPVHRLSIPTPFPVGPVNVYLITADPITLVDTGPWTPEAEIALRKGIEKRGYDLRDIRRIFITHGHYDHAGQAGLISQLTGADIYIHPNEAKKIEAGEDFLTLRRDILRRGGMPEELLEDAWSESQHRNNFWLEISRSIPVYAGDTLAFENFTLEVLHTPGHANGHLCLYNREAGVLLAGDTLLAHISPNPVLEVDPEEQDGRAKSLMQYMESLSSLEALAIREVYTGHGRMIKNPAKRMEEIRHHHQERGDVIVETIVQDSKTPFEISLEVFGPLTGHNTMLAISEVWGQLDLLEQMGRVSRMGSNGVTRYHAMP